MTCTAYSPLVAQLHRQFAEASAPRRRRFRRTEADRVLADRTDGRFVMEQRLRAKAKRTMTFGSLKPKRFDLWLTLGLPKGNRRSD